MSRASNDEIAPVGGFGDDHKQVSAGVAGAEDSGRIGPSGHRQAWPCVEGLFDFQRCDVVSGDVGIRAFGPRGFDRFFL